METRARCEPRDHAVLFYDGDDQLVETVVGHLVEGLRRGERAVVVAIADHIAAFEAALSLTGVDVVAARASGLWLTFDAADALSRFLVGDRPDPEAFAAEIGDLVRRVADGVNGVRVYGEMVALLWDAGHVAAAIELEDLWNELGQAVPFSLLCAYPVTSVTDQDDEDSFHRLCHCHSTVVGGMPTRAPVVDSGGSVRTEATRSFGCDPSELSAARRFVGGLLVAWNLERYAADASIVVSELATNAIGHAQSEFIVALSSRDGALRIAVRDASRELPVVRDPSPTTMTGRGLVLVNAIARSWGTESVADGKVVWAELSA